MKLTYAVVIVQNPNNYGAYAPDVPGCVSVGDTWEEMQAMIRGGRSPTTLRTCLSRASPSRSR